MHFVGSRGAIMFFASRGDESAQQQAEAVWKDALQFSDFLGRFAAGLRNAYAAGVTVTERR